MNTHMIERFEEFQGGPSRRDRSKPRVTLSNRSVMLLNRVAYEALGAPAAVKLRYEEDRRMIGLVPHDPSRANAFPVKQCSGKTINSRRVYLHPFCRHWGIDMQRTVLFHEVDFDND